MLSVASARFGVAELVYTVFDKKEDTYSRKQRRTATAGTDVCLLQNRILFFFLGTDREKLSEVLTISYHYTLETADVYCQFAWRKYTEEIHCRPIVLVDKVQRHHFTVEQKSKRSFWQLPFVQDG